MKILDFFKVNKNILTITMLRFNFLLSDEFAKGRAEYIRNNVPLIYSMVQSYIGSQPYTVAYDIYLSNKIKPIVEKHGLKIVDEDYMGLTAYSIYKDNVKIVEFFNTEKFSKIEEVYWFIKSNYSK